MDAHMFLSTAGHVAAGNHHTFSINYVKWCQWEYFCPSYSCKTKTEHTDTAPAVVLRILDNAVAAVGKQRGEQQRARSECVLKHGRRHTRALVGGVEQVRPGCAEHHGEPDALYRVGRRHEEDDAVGDLYVELVEELV